MKIAYYQNCEGGFCAYIIGHWLQTMVSAKTKEEAIFKLLGSQNLITEFVAKYS